MGIAFVIVRFVLAAILIIGPLGPTSFAADDRGGMDGVHHALDTPDHDCCDPEPVSPDRTCASACMQAPCGSIALPVPAGWPLTADCLAVWWTAATVLRWKGSSTRPTASSTTEAQPIAPPESVSRSRSAIGDDVRMTNRFVSYQGFDYWLNMVDGRSEEKARQMFGSTPFIPPDFHPAESPMPKWAPTRQSVPKGCLCGECGKPIERNGRVVPRAEHERTEVREGDRIEVVTLVGGG